MTDLYGSLIAIADGNCTSYLVQIRNGHGRKNYAHHKRLEDAKSEASKLVALGWSVAIVRRTDSLIELQGTNPPTTLLQRV